MSIKALPSMEFTFTVELKGTETGKAYSGTFTYKRPNLRSKSDIAKMKARLNEDLRNLDEDTSFVHGIISNLRHTLQKYPEWWLECDFGYELYDVNVILDIYKECRKFEDDWFEAVWGNQEEEKPKKKEAKKKASEK